MSDRIRPLPDDPGRDEIVSFFDLGSDEWINTAEGEYATSAGEAMKSNGANFQRVVMLQWPGRVNNSDERRTVRLLMAPEDALGLAEVLAHTAGWMLKEARDV